MYVAQWFGGKKEGKHAIKWTRLSCTTFRANAVRLQLHALAYNLANLLRTLALPGRGRTVVADHATGEGREDRRESDRPRPIRDLPDGGGGGVARAVRPHLGADREAAAARPGPMLTLEGCNGRQQGVERRPACVLGVPQSGRTARGDVPDPRGGPHDGRTPLPARPQRHYASPGTGMDTVHLGNVG
jgi:Transposase DDE domain group 1